MSLTVAFPDFSARRSSRVRQSFECTLQVGDVGPALVHVAGELDIGSARRLEQALSHADSTPRMVVLDLRELTSIDSFGVDVIVDASARARWANRRLMLVRGPPQIDHAFALAGATDVLEIIDLDQLEPTARALAWLPEPDDAA